MKKFHLILILLFSFFISLSLFAHICKSFESMESMCVHILYIFCFIVRSSSASSSSSSSSSSSLQLLYAVVHRCRRFCSHFSPLPVVIRIENGFHLFIRLHSTLTILYTSCTIALLQVTVHTPYHERRPINKERKRTVRGTFLLAFKRISPNKSKQ